MTLTGPGCWLDIYRSFKQIKEFGLDPTNSAIAVDVDASARHMTWNSMNLPCITRSRHRGHWITNKKRRTTIKEMLCFQGIAPGSIKQTCSDAEFGKMVGNSMSLNVVERILYAGAHHPGRHPGFSHTD